MGALLAALKAWVRVSPWRLAPSRQTRDEIEVVLAGQRWRCRKSPKGRLQAPCCLLCEARRIARTPMLDQTATEIFCVDAAINRAAYGLLL